MEKDDTAGASVTLSPRQFIAEVVTYLCYDVLRRLTCHRGLRLPQSRQHLMVLIATVVGRTGSSTGVTEAGEGRGRRRSSAGDDGLKSSSTGVTKDMRRHRTEIVYRSNVSRRRQRKEEIVYRSNEGQKVESEGGRL